MWCWWRTLVWLDDPEDRLIIFSPSGHPRATMWPWEGLGSSMLGDLGGPSGSHSSATVFVYRAYGLDLQDLQDVCVCHCGQSRPATASSRPSATYQTWGLPKNWNARHRGTRTKCPIVCNVVIDMPRCSALCNALLQPAGELQGSLGGLRRARAREVRQRHMQAREAVAGKPGRVWAARATSVRNQGRTLLPAWPIPSLVSKAITLMNASSTLSPGIIKPPSQFYEHHSACPYDLAL